VTTSVDMSAVGQSGEQLPLKIEPNLASIQPTTKTSTIADDESATEALGADFSESSLDVVAAARHGSHDIKADFNVVVSSLEQQTSVKIQEALPIGRIQFDRCRMYGREEHIAKLQGALHRVNKKSQNQGDNHTEFVLIDGLSGSGKTVLATSVQGDVERAPKGAFLQGKFDLAVREEPYSALASAFQDLCGQASDILGKEAFDQFQEETAKNLDPQELGFLHIIIPSLSRIVPVPTTSTETDAHVRNSFKMNDQKKLLHSGFVKFIRLAGATFCPLVIFLDDLQWADVSSVDLLKVLISDEVNTNLMVIGSYRSNEVKDDLLEMLDDLRMRQNGTAGSKRQLLKREESRRLSGLPNQDVGTNLTLTELSLGNLSVECVQDLIMDLLSLEEESITMPLAQLLHRRTLGNPNFLKTFITCLYDDKLLSFNMGKMKWTWDLSAIEKSSSATDNVVDLTRRGIQKNTSEEMHHLLLCVACLGNICGLEHIRMIWMKSSVGGGADRSEALLQELLDKSVEQMFLERIGQSQFRYSHDAVKEAVISLIPKTNFDTLLQKVGGILFEELSEEELEAMLFLVADLLHASDSKDPIKLAKLLLRAAHKAKGVSAYSSASFYAIHGIKQLPQMWEGDENIQLAVRLHSIAAEAERGLGNLPQAKLLCETIIGQSQVSVFDKLQAHKILIDILVHEQNFFISLEYCLEHLGETIGCHFQRGKTGMKVAAFLSIQQMKKRKSILSNEEIDDLPMMTEPTRLFGIELMQTATLSAFYAGEPILMLNVLTRRIQWSLKYGFHPSLGSAYATMAAVFMHVIGDWGRGRRMAEAAVHVGQRASALGRSSHWERDVIVRLLFLVYPWTQPARSIPTQMITGYKSCMIQGDVDSAFKILVGHFFNQILSGQRLEEVEADARGYSEQIASLKYDKWFYLLGLVGQAALNLMGKTENTTFLEVDETDPGDWQMCYQLQYVKRFLYAHFGEYKTGAKNSMTYGWRWIGAYPGMYFGYDMFHQAICHYQEAIHAAHNEPLNACKPPKSKSPLALHKKHAYKCHADIESWVKRGAPNHVHHLSILKAERATLLSCSKKIEPKKVCKLYETAIVDSVRGGFVNHAAIAEEHYADYLWGVGEKDEGIYHLENAIQRFSEWGAVRRVEMLREKLANLENEGMSPKLADESLGSVEGKFCQPEKRGSMPQLNVHNVKQKLASLETDGSNPSPTTADESSGSVEGNYCQPETPVSMAMLNVQQVE